MNRLKASIAAALIGFTPYTFAGEDSNGFFVWADVTSVNPIVSTGYETVPVTHCTTVRKPMHAAYGYDDDDYRDRRYRSEDRFEDRHRNDDALPALVGGVLGGAIGNQFGSGNGRKAMTVVGAILGASIASANQHRSDDHYERIDDRRARNHHSRGRVCDTSYEKKAYSVVEGYDVTYRYMGREFDRVTEEHPGDRIKLYVTVDPVDKKVI